MRNQDKNTYIEQLHHQHFNRLIRLAYRQTGDIEIAKELVQDVFVQALLDYEILVSHENPGAWLSLVLSNRALNYRRLLERRAEVPLEPWLEDALFAHTDHSLEEVLPAELSKSEREILLWRFRDQMDHRTIANLLGVSEAACRTRLTRALKRCEKLLTKK